MRIFNSFQLALLILIILSAFSCDLESDSPRTIHIEGIVTYQSDGSPAEKVTVQMWRWENDFDDWDDDFSKILSTEYMYSIATDYTNEDGEYKIVYNLKDNEYCLGNGFCNIRASKAGYKHKNWPAVSVHCTEDIQIINFQLY